MRYCQLFFVAYVVLLMAFNSIAASKDASCFWNLAGVKQLLNGVDNDVTVFDTTFCKIKPKLFIHEETYRVNGYLNSILLMTTQGDDLFISLAPSRECLTCVGCKCIISFSKPMQVTLPNSGFTKTTGAALVTTRTIQTRNANDSISVIIAITTGLLEVTFIDIHLHSRFNPEKPDFTFDIIRAFTLTEKTAGQKITGIASMNDTGSIAVFGTNGLLRVLTFSEIITEKEYDVGTKDSLVCFGDEYVGSADGTIYFIGKTQLVAETGVPLQYISSSGAASENGLVFEHRDNNWNKFSTGNISIKNCSFINTAKGREVLIIDDEYTLHQFFLYDTPTIITVDSLSGLLPNMNSVPFVCKENDTISALFTLIDPEGNIKWPKVELHTRDTSFQIACNKPLFGSTFRMSFTQKCIEKIETTQFFMCPYPPDCEISSGPPCTTRVFWKTSDSVVITTENERLIIINGPPVSVDKFAKRHSASSELKKVANNVITAIRQGKIFLHNSRDISISIYTIQGKSVSMDNFNFALSSGAYLLQISSGKNQLTHRFCILGNGM